MANPGWIDISIPLRSGMVHWPGDPPVIIERRHDMERGDSSNLSFLSMSAHSGTHIDAPRHFIREGKAISEMPLELMLGRARVIAIEGASIEPEELERHQIREGERVLFRTANSERVWAAPEFVEDYVYVSSRGARFLAERRIGLVGVDYLSVSGFKRDVAETHRALFSAGSWLLEGLDLSLVEPGDYYLACLPLRIEGGEGAPARALVRRLTNE